MSGCHSKRGKVERASKILPAHDKFAGVSGKNETLLQSLKQLEVSSIKIHSP
jgi:hypothetical protein